MFVLFGAASGPIEPFNISLLAQKGSLFATRPTLVTFMADRARAEKMARELFRVVERGDVKIQIGGKWPLAQVADAHVALEKRETTGSLILLP
jgi:NADPH2:quinone reductase